MNESVLRALMQLAALVAQINQQHFKKNAHALIKSYLELTQGKKSNRDLIIRCLEFYTNYNNSYESKNFNANPELLPSEIKGICRNLNTQLSITDRYVLLFSILELINSDGIITSEETFLTKTLAEEFKIESLEFDKAFDFIINENPINFNHPDYCIIENYTDNNSEELEGTWIEKNKPSTNNKYHTYHQQELNGNIYIVRFAQADFIVFKYIGFDKLFLTKQPIINNKYYRLRSYDYIQLNLTKIDYFEIAEHFRNEQYLKLQLNGFNINAFKYKERPSFEFCFNFSETSGSLIGIIGNSASTLNIIENLSGRASKIDGSVLLNQFNVYSEYFKISKYIGFVPENPLYSDYFTIYENILSAAKLTFTKISLVAINEKVKQALELCRISEIQNLFPNSNITGFSKQLQKVLINMAIELVRNPSVLFIQSPFEYQSVPDSEIIIQILKKFVQQGNIAFVTARQPNSAILNYSDRLWIFDDENYIIYKGDTHNVFSYFQQYKPDFKFNTDQLIIGNANNPELINRIIHQKELDDKGNLTIRRKISPKDWNQQFKEKIEQPEHFEQRKVLPIHQSTNASFDKQYLLLITNTIPEYIKKLKSNYKELVVFIGISLIITALMRSDWTSKYMYGNNPNIYPYTLTSLLILFLRGFVLAEKENNSEAYKIKHLIFRNLSFFSILNAKITWWVISSLFCSLVFASIGCIFLKTNQYFLYYWLTFFTISFLGNISGILISNLFRKRAFTYLALLVILSYNILFNGITINHQNFPKIFGSENNGPLIADLSPIKWAIEAMTVEQSINNKYEKQFYPIEKKLEVSKYNINYLIPSLQQKLLEINNISSSAFRRQLMGIIQNEIRQLPDNNPEIFSFEYIDSLTSERINDPLIEETIEYLTYAQIILSDQIRVLVEDKKQIEQRIIDSIGEQKYSNFKYSNFNPYLLEIINRTKSNNIITFTNSCIIKQINPLFLKPVSNFGRSHLFAPVKLFNSFYYNTFWFNMFFLWVYIFILYLIVNCLPIKRLK